MSRRWRLHDVDPATWPAFDASALPEVQREVFAARRRAVELYAAGCALREIEIRTQILRGNLYRMLDRCFAPLNAQLLDAPFRCRHCRRYYGSKSGPRRPFISLSRERRIAVTRAAVGAG